MSMPRVSMHNIIRNLIARYMRDKDHKANGDMAFSAKPCELFQEASEIIENAVEEKGISLLFVSI